MIKKSLIVVGILTILAVIYYYYKKSTEYKPRGIAGHPVYYDMTNPQNIAQVEVKGAVGGKGNPIEGTPSTVGTVPPPVS